MTEPHTTGAAGVAAIETSIHQHVRYALGKAWRDLPSRDLFTAVALSDYRRS